MVAKVHRLKRRCRGFFRLNKHGTRYAKKPTPNLLSMALLPEKPTAGAVHEPLCEWIVHLSRAGGKHPIATRTRDEQPGLLLPRAGSLFESGEHLECIVVVPIPKSDKPDDVLWLKCQARVLRVEAVATDTAFRRRISN